MNQPAPSTPSPDLLAQVALQTHSPVVITDARGLTQWVNAAFERMTGFDLASMVGRKPGALLQGPRTSAEAVREIRDRIAAREPVVGVELLNYDRQGRPYWVALDITPVRGAGGEVTHFISIQSLRSERHAADAQIARLTQRLALALDAAGLGVWEVADDDVGLRLDATAQRLLGVQAAGADSPVPWARLPATLAGLRAQLRRSMRDGTSVDTEAWFGDDSNRWRCLHFRGQRVQAAGEEGVVGVVADSTAVVEMQASAEAQSLQTMLDTERRDLLGRLRREMRDPLNGLLGFAQLLRMHTVQRDEQASIVQRIEHMESSAQRLLDMLDELIAAGAGDTDEGRALLQPVALRDAVQRFLPREVAVAPERSREALPVLWASPVLLRRVLSLAGSLGLAPGGAGSAPRLEWLGADALHRAGVSFLYPHRLGETSDGAGLRLALIRRLMSEMGGACEVMQVASGTRIDLRLRVAEGVRGDPAEAPRAPAPALASWSTRDDVAGEVLYVEDNAGNVALVEHALRSRPGVRLRVASNVDEAETLLARDPLPALVLVDLMLPGRSGRDLLQAMWDDPRLRGVPRVVLTSIDDFGREADLRQLGVSDYLLKPLRLNRLLDLVDTHLAAAPAKPP
jgi:PAS domain S-box-containing protein